MGKKGKITEGVNKIPDVYIQNEKLEEQI
jgi:uncharacterized protein (DUF3084 family)